MKTMKQINKTLKQREAAYGDYITTATRYGAMHGKPSDTTLLARDMIKVKLARLESNPAHFDSWLDIAGYAHLILNSMKRD